MCIVMVFTPTEADGPVQIVRPMDLRYVCIPPGTDCSLNERVQAIERDLLPCWDLENPAVTPIHFDGLLYHIVTCDARLTSGKPEWHDMNVALLASSLQIIECTYFGGAIVIPPWVAIDRSQIKEIIEAHGRSHNSGNRPQPPSSPLRIA